MGRPSKYTKKLADDICSQIADGQSLRAICEKKGMPTRETVRKWLRDNPNFLAQHVRAREEQGDSDADRIQDITQGVLDGLIDPQAGKVAIDALKWIAAKRTPKKYGEKIEHAVSGDLDVRVVIGGNA